MFEKLLQPEVQQFIASHEGSDIAALALRQNPFPEIPYPFILDQVSGKSKARLKLPLWHDTPGIVYPSRVSMEQASSQATAQYKASLAYGGDLIDLTGGFGVDDVFFAQHFDQVLHCERDRALSDLVSHNLKVLGVGNVVCFAGDSSQALANRDKWDCIYIDPSRRSESKGKVFLLSDCAPDVTVHLPEYFEKSDRILIKASPMMDIAAAATQLSDIAAVHVVALRHEVREIIFDLRKGSRSFKIYTVNLETSQAPWRFDPEDNPLAPLSAPLRYLYEPNAAVMKSGGFGALARDLNLCKLHRHSHLFTADRPIDFPGRAFVIGRVVPFNNQGQRELSALGKANIAVRNFPLDVAQARKKLKLADGGDIYCFLTTGPDEQKIALICSKIG